MNHTRGVSAHDQADQTFPARSGRGHGARGLRQEGRTRAGARRGAGPRAPKAEPLKAAWVYVGPVGDAGWTFAHDQGRKAVEAEYGDKIVTSFVEKVPEGADAERVIRDLAAQGNKIIFATSFGYMEPMVKVAADFPDVKFEHATGYKTSANMRVYDAKFFEDAYLAGVIAGKMTKTNTLGFVASFPIPEVLRNINAFTLGAQSVNPKVKTKVVWVSTWFDPPKESDAAQSLINGGADVLLQNTDSSGRAADGREERQVRLRLGQRHERRGAEGASGVLHRRLGPLLHQGDQGSDGRQLEDRARGLGRQGRPECAGEGRRQGAGRGQGTRSRSWTPA